MKRVIIFLFVCIILLCGCSNTSENDLDTKGSVDITETIEESVSNPNAPKSEEQMLTDLEDRSFFEESMILDSLTVIKRQTKQEDRTDVVYVTVKSHNEKVETARSFVLTYNLYNEGWILDDISSYWEGENTAKPLAGPDDSMLDALFLRYNAIHDDIYRDPPYSEWTIAERSVDLEGRTAYFVVDAKRELPLCVRRERMTVEFCFYDDIFWCEASTIPSNDVVYTLDRSRLIGDYYAERSYLYTHEYTLSITDVDEENQTITLYATDLDGRDGDIQEWKGTFNYTVIGEWNRCLECELDKNWDLKIYSDSIFLGDVRMFDARDGVNE